MVKSKRQWDCPSCTVCNWIRGKSADFSALTFRVRFRLSVMQHKLFKVIRLSSTFFSEPAKSKKLVTSKIIRLQFLKKVCCWQRNCKRLILKLSSRRVKLQNWAKYVTNAQILQTYDLTKYFLKLRAIPKHSFFRYKRFLLKIIQKFNLVLKLWDKILIW